MQTDNFHIETGREDKRAAKRQRVLKDGRIVFSNYDSVVDCTIRDISETGAKLYCMDQAVVPVEFALLVMSNSHIRNAQVRWRRGDLLGVKFTSEPRRAPARKL